MAFEQAYKPQLQGVSQQLPKLRLDGQVSVQENMLSDAVTDLRRRPGAQHTFNLSFPGEDYLSIKAWETDIAGQRVHVFVGSNTGVVKLLDEEMVEIVVLLQSPYLITDDNKKIRATTIGNDFYLLNTGVMPTLLYPVSPGTDPAKQGFFFIRAGAFSKNYQVVLTTNVGTATLLATTPTGANPGDAAASTPEAIAAALAGGANVALLASVGVVATVSGAYAYLSAAVGTTSIAAASSSGSSYITTSTASRVRLESDLPAHLPAIADGYIMAVGEQKLFRYYRYKASTTEWLESGTWNSPEFIANMPISIKYVAGVWSIDSSNYEGRTAGDEDTNPIPEFLTRGLSGMGAFQSRLVLLGGSKVYMSSSTTAKRFFRSTVTGLLDADPIAVGASANSSAEYVYAVPFQKDLLLFSRKYQALVPAAGAAVTPRTATVLLTSSYSVDLGCEPVPVGRTLLFPAPRSADFFGFMEMVSSQYTDSQYVSNDASAHLPKYMAGTCRYAVSSPVSSMVLFGPTSDLTSLIVYEYQWDGDVKAQQSWHKWRLPYPVASAHFASGVANFTFIQNGHMVGVSIDTKLGSLTTSAVRRPFMDMHIEVQVVDRQVIIPSWMLTFDPDIGTKLKLAVATGPQAGDWVGAEYADGVLTTVRSFPNGLVTMGIPFKSSYSPTPPVIRDRHGDKIESDKVTVLRYLVSTQNSAEYNILITDSLSEDPMELIQSTLQYSSTELTPGQARVSSRSKAIVPARTDADSTILLMSTEGLGEMNFTGIEYTARMNQRRSRR